VIIRSLAAAVLCAGPLLASDASFDLKGTVTGAEGVRGLRVQLFSVQTSFTASAWVEDGRFRFPALAPGDYTVALVREGFGEARRTVVVSPSLAHDGTVTAVIPYEVSEAAAVSVRRLAVTRKAVELYERARRLLGEQDTGHASALLRRAVAEAPDFADAWNVLGVLAFEIGDLGEAERCYRQAAQADPEAFDAPLNLGALLLRTSRANEALPFHLRAASLRPADAGANAQLGMNYFQLGRFEEAEPFLAQARRLDPGHPSQPQLFLAEIYRLRGQHRAAADVLRELSALRPDDARLRIHITALAAAEGP
jgi:Flp pilus assembly protein TadD